MEKIVIIGGGGHAKSVIALLKKIGQHYILGYTDVTDKGVILGVPYLGDDTRLADIKAKHPGCGAAIGVGSVKVSDQRIKVQQRIEQLGLKQPVIISPSAIIGEDVTIGEGTVIHDGAVVNVGTVIGRSVIINTNVSIDHDCVIGDFVHVAPGVTLSGGVKVGQNTFISVGANVIQYKTIGNNCLIGAGATVIDDCMETGVYLGTPAKRR